MRPFSRPMNGTLIVTDPNTPPLSPTTTQPKKPLRSGTMNVASHFIKVHRLCLMKTTGIRLTIQTHTLLQACYKNPHMLKRLKHHTQCPKRDKIKCCPNPFSWTKMTQCHPRQYWTCQCHNRQSQFKSQILPHLSSHKNFPHHGHPRLLSRQS